MLLTNFLTAITSDFPIKWGLKSTSCRYSATYISGHVYRKIASITIITLPASLKLLYLYISTITSLWLPCQLMTTLFLAGKVIALYMPIYFVLYHVSFNIMPRVPILRSYKFLLCVNTLSEIFCICQYI